MGRKKGPKLPPPPDPQALARAQTQSNIETAQAQAALNRINEQTPYYSVQYQTTPGGPFGVGETTRTVSLDPQDQAFADQLRQQSMAHGQRAGDVLGQDMFHQPTMDAMLGRLQPQLDQSRRAMETRLANQGITIGSRAFDQEMDRLSRAENDLRLAATLQAGQEGRANRSQMMGELTGLRNLMPGAPQIQTPQVGVAPTDTMTPALNAYNAQVAQALQDQQARSGFMGGLFGLGGAVLGGLAGNPGLGLSVGQLFGGRAVSPTGPGFQNASALWPAGYVPR